MSYGDGYFMMTGMHWLWWIFWLALIGAVLYGLTRTGRQRRSPRETPEEVLRRRLANGEITPEQYEERRALIDRDARGKA